MKVIAQNQMKLAKKVDLMNKRLKNFLSEAVTSSPIDLNSLSVQDTPIEDFSDLSIDSSKKPQLSGSGVRTITSKNTNPFDPTWTSQKEAVKKEEPLPKGINRTKTIEEMFPEVVGVEEQVKQLEAEMKKLSATPKSTVPPPPRPRQPTMEELIQKNLAMQNGLLKPETPLSENVKPKKKKTVKAKKEDVPPLNKES
jgi:hypothetical protein